MPRTHIDLGRTDKAALQADFSKVAWTSPAKAAATILRGVERGEHRVLIGPDARAADLLARLAPVRYFDVIRRLQPLLRR